MGNSSQFLTHKIHLKFPAAVWTSDFSQHCVRAAQMEPQLNHCVTLLPATVLKKKKKMKCIAGHTCTPDPEKYIHHILIRNKKERGRGIANWNAEEKRRGHRQSIWACMFCFFFLPKSSEFFFFHSLLIFHAHILYLLECGGLTRSNFTAVGLNHLRTCSRMTLN